MELRFSPLFSGSSGNATYVGCDDAQILVDAGLSGSRVSQELRRVGVDPARLDAILVTHEHADHIRGIGILSRKFDLPVYATEGTWAGMFEKIGPIAEKNRIIFDPDQDFFLGSINVTPFATPHDAAQPVGYTFELDGAKLAIATDLGCIREGWMNRVLGADAVILESNYDPDMLRAGSYPYELKKRILSRRGHLSNDDAGAVAVELIKNGTRQIILGHLSKESNFPQLAMRSCELILQQAGLTPQEDATIYIANRDGNTGMFSICASFVNA